ncbi:DUF1385 domain-containing protein [Candidatus Woesearchaeota archaeon]|nr:MAG: DUF1385 domain-containing protein [Candidatus Woesearchaeota archaeon]
MMISLARTSQAGASQNRSAQPGPARHLDSRSMLLRKANTAIFTLLLHAATLVIGGQAVMGGVMLKHKEHLVIAVREQSGRIKTLKETFPSLTDRYPFLKLPFLRGVIILFETLIIGYKSLHLSTNIALGQNQEELTKKELAIIIILAIAFALFLFKVLPLAGATLLQPLFGPSNLLFNLADAGIKLSIFILYLSLIGLLPDIRELFAYHGAEHKVVNCYEARKALTVANAKKQSTKQPRCGTTFMLFVLLLSAFVYLLIPPSLGFSLKLALRIALLPLVASISYELIRLAGKCYRHPWARWLIAPGMLVQKLTTREPTAKQLTVGLRALTTLLALHAKQTKKQSARN